LAGLEAPVRALLPGVQLPSSSSSSPPQGGDNGITRGGLGRMTGFFTLTTRGGFLGAILGVDASGSLNARGSLLKTRPPRTRGAFFLPFPPRTRGAFFLPFPPFPPFLPLLPLLERPPRGPRRRWTARGRLLRTMRRVSLRPMRLTSLRGGRTWESGRKQGCETWEERGWVKYGRNGPVEALPCLDHSPSCQAGALHHRWPCAACCLAYTSCRRYHRPRPSRGLERGRRRGAAA